MPIFGRPSRKTVLRLKLLHTSTERASAAAEGPGVSRRIRAQRLECMRRTARGHRGSHAEGDLREPVCGHPCSAGCSGTAGAKCTAERAHCVRAPCAGNRRVRAPWSAERSATAREGPRKYVEALPQRTRGDPVCDHRRVDSQARKQCKKIA